MEVEWLALGISLFGISISGLFAYLAYHADQRSRRAETQNQIARLYDQFMDFRARHPEVLALSRKWTEQKFPAVYRQRTAQDKDWALYYTYVEFCIGYCNSVQYARELGLLDRSAYLKHFRPLVKLVLTEHYPYVSSIRQGPYLSEFIKKLMRELEQEGWDWNERHKRLAGTNTNP